ncbi:hypothetical protein HJ581_0008300 [Rhodococcus opacus]|nr:hypothetical protein HJ581_0008300 [Rhodococcus opacus]
MSVHEVKITRTVDGPRIEFTCNADPTADCRNYPDCECESWEQDHPHPTAPHDKCWMQDWFDNGGTVPSVDGFDEHDLAVGMKGPIKTYFCTDYIEWEFVTEAHS